MCSGAPGGAGGGPMTAFKNPAGAIQQGAASQAGTDTPMGRAVNSIENAQGHPVGQPPTQTNPTQAHEQQRRAAADKAARQDPRQQGKQHVTGTGLPKSQASSVGKPATNEKLNIPT